MMAVDEPAHHARRQHVFLLGARTSTGRAPCAHTGPNRRCRWTTPARRARYRHAACVSGGSALATPSISSAIRMAGKVSCTSAMRMMMLSVPAADIAGDEADRDANGHREQHGAQADQQRDAQAVEDQRDKIGPLVCRCRAGSADRPSPRPAAEGCSSSSSAPGSKGLVRRDPRREDGASTINASVTTAEPPG